MDLQGLQKDYKVCIKDGMVQDSKGWDVRAMVSALSEDETDATCALSMIQLENGRRAAL